MIPFRFAVASFLGVTLLVSSVPAAHALRATDFSEERRLATNHLREHKRLQSRVRQSRIAARTQRRQQESTTTGRARLLRATRQSAFSRNRAQGQKGVLRTGSTSATHRRQAGALRTSRLKTLRAQRPALDTRGRSQRQNLRRQRVELKKRVFEPDN